MLSEPFPPTPYKPIGLVILDADFVSKLFGVPHQHIVVDLHAFRIQHYVADPVRQPARSVHLMKQPLMIFALGLNVLEKHHLEKVSLQEYVYDPWTHLDNRQVEEEGWTQQWQVHVVINVRKGVILLVWQRLNEFVIHSLLKGPHALRLMLEELS